MKIRSCNTRRDFKYSFFRKDLVGGILNNGCALSIRAVQALVQVVRSSRYSCLRFSLVHLRRSQDLANSAPTKTPTSGPTEAQTAFKPSAIDGVILLSSLKVRLRRDLGRGTHPPPAAVLLETPVTCSCMILS